MLFIFSVKINLNDRPLSQFYNNIYDECLLQYQRISSAWACTALTNSGGSDIEDAKRLK
jgi:hypothetical protein